MPFYGFLEYLKKWTRFEKTTSDKLVNTQNSCFSVVLPIKQPYQIILYHFKVLNVNLKDFLQQFSSLFTHCGIFVSLHIGLSTTFLGRHSYIALFPFI